MARITLGRDSSGRPLVVDDTTLAKLRAAESRLGLAFTVVQGSWRGTSGAAASAGTHDRGGVIDLRTWDIPPSIGIDRAVRVLRECGLIAWHRTPAQGFDHHIHAIDYGNPDLAPSAARQVTSWQNGRNGLANNGPDDGPRVDIPKNAPAVKDWFDMADKADLKAALVEVLGSDAGKKAIHDALDTYEVDIVRSGGKVVKVPFRKTIRENETELDGVEGRLDALTALVQQAVEAGK